MATSSCVRLADAKPFAKFFRMLRIGLPEDAVRQAMRVQGVDERVLALGGDALVSDLPDSSAVPRKASGPQVDDRVYRKSLRMLLVGVPPAAVEASMQRALDTTAYDQTLGKLKAALARRSAAALGPWDSMATKAVPLTETVAVNVATFEKMERVGVPTGAVQQAQHLAVAKAAGSDAVGGYTQDDGQGGSESAWTKLFLVMSSSPVGQQSDMNAIEKPLLEHPAVGRFFKMIHAGVPEDAVKTALARAGLPQELVGWDPTLPASSLAVDY